MQDLSHLADGYPSYGASQSAGNTTGSADGWRLSQTAEGSASIVPPSPTRDINVIQPGPSEDFARLVNSAGGEAVRPANDGGGWTMAFQPDAIWAQQ
jgi:hypothetical protein